VTGKIAVGSKIAGAALTTDRKYLAVATIQPPKVVLIDTKTDKVVHETALPVAPVAIAAATDQVAVLLPASPKSAMLARVSIPDGALAGISPIGAGAVAALEYRKDTETIFVAAPDSREIVALSAKTGSVLARLPVPIRPARFCVTADGGQVFVTGADNDPQLVIFSPYQNQIYETLYAGHALFGMAIAPVLNLLFLSNPDSGDVSILDIETLRFAAKMIHTGGKPREMLVAPSTGPEEYAFAVDAETGDVAVIHIPVVLHKRGDPFIAEPPKPVFAVFHGGADPQSAVIVPYST
jgi:DNA-binding beta-propeller fold protein YncE